MLVERDAELAMLSDAVDAARDGNGAIALVAGGAGLGKTTLLEALRGQLGGRCDIFWGGCDALLTPRALGPIYDMAGALGERLTAKLETNADPYTLFSALLAELETRKGASLIVVEDAHWADNATLDFLKYLGRRISRLNALLILSYRDDEVDTAHPLNMVLGDFPHDRVRRLRLAPLTLEGVEALGEGSDSDAQSLLDITGGNPFFVTELLASGGKLSEGIPASVREAVNARLNRLPEPQRKFLEALSIFPRPVSEAILAESFEGEIGDLLSVCLDEKLLLRDESGNIRFRHELARLATLARLSPTQQRAQHDKALSVLRGQDMADAPLDWMVHHADGALDGAVILEMAPEAGRQAAAVGSHREAVAHYATALRHVGEAEPELAAQLYQDWAYEAYLALRIDDEVLEARRQAIALWRALKRPEKVGENLRWLSRMHWYRGESTQANRLANEAVKVMESAAPSAERAWAYSLRSQLHMLNTRMDKAIEWGERALELAEEFDNIEVRIHALNNIATALFFLDRPGAVERYQESLDLSLSHGFHEHAARVYTNLTEYATEFRQFDVAEKYVSDGVTFDTEHDLDSWLHYLVGRKAQLRVEQGQLRDAERIATAVVNMKGPTMLMRLPALIALARARMRLGDTSAGSLLAGMLENALTINETQYIVPARLALIEHAWLKTQHGEAETQLTELLEADFNVIHKWYRGEICCWLRRFDMDVPKALSVNVPEPFELELQGDIQGAAQSWRNLGAPYNAALTLAQSDGEAQEERLVEALSLLAPLEAKGAIKKLREIADAQGVTLKKLRMQRGPYSSSRNHPAGLTGKEQQVLTLVAAGMTNKEIADELSRSQRTIEHHVSAIIGKMEVANRMEVIVRANKESWLLPQKQVG